VRSPGSSPRSIVWACVLAYSAVYPVWVGHFLYVPVAISRVALPPCMGDVVPQTAVGRAVAGVVALMGVVAVSLFTSSVVSVAVAPRERRGFREELEELLRKYENSPDRELVERVRAVLQEASR